MASSQSSHDMWPGRGRPQTLGNVQARHRSESRRLSDQRRPIKVVARKHAHCPGALHEGDPVRVFSRSADKWVDGEVVKLVEDDFVWVEYEVEGDRCGKTMHRQSEHLGIHSSGEDSLDWYLRHGPSGQNSIREVPAGYEILPLQCSPFRTERCDYLDFDDFDGCRFFLGYRGDGCPFHGYDGCSEGGSVCGWSGGDLLRHRATGVILLGKAISVQRWSTGGDLVLYHYCPEDAFTSIASSRDFLASTRLATDCDFGVGVYAAKQQPHKFRKIVDILYNNYPRATSKYPQGHADFPAESRASYCIPFLVDSKWTPALPLSDPDGQTGAICETQDRHGAFDPNSHDIWIVDASKAESGGAVGGIKQQSALALLKATEQGQAGVVKDLLLQPSNVDAANPRGQTALHLACARSVDIVGELISARACVNLADNCGKTALTLSASVNNRLAIFHLLSARADVNTADCDGSTALLLLADHDYLDYQYTSIRELLTARADINHADSHGMAALLLAAYPKSGESSREIICELLSARADVNHASFSGESALLAAVHNWAEPERTWGSYKQQTAVVRELLSARACANLPDSEGRAALQLACADHSDVWDLDNCLGPNIDVICELLSARADVNHADSHGETALLWAAKPYVRGEEVRDGADTQQTVVSKLLCARASANLAQLDGVVALQLAMSPSAIDKVRRLLSARADPNCAVQFHRQ